MTEEFEYVGMWWLTDKREKQVCGTLRFTSGEGTVLDLIGSFHSKEIKGMTKNSGEMLKPEIILGVSSNGEKVTLHKCFETNREFSLSGFEKSSFYANEIFIGAHFQKKEDMNFKSISIHYPHLDEWVNKSGFYRLHEPDSKEEIIKYKHPESIQATISDDYTIFIDFRSTLSIIIRKEESIKQRIYIRIESSEEKSWDEYLNILYHIRNFLSLGIAEPVYPLAIEGITEANKEMKNEKASIKIFYHLNILKAPETLIRYDMLFTLEDISNRFEVFMRNWFEKADLLEPVYDLYFGILFNPQMYLQHRFLSLIQAIESFHQRIYKGEYLSDDDYKGVYRSLVNAIPDIDNIDFKKSLENRLKYGNEYSLRKRLKEIFEKYKEILNGFIESKNSFIEKVVDTRNYLTHYDKDLKELAVSGEALYSLTQKLKILLETCLLSELGFSSDKIKDLFLRNRRYQEMMKTKAETNMK